MNPTEENKFNMRLLGGATIVVMIFIVFVVITTMGCTRDQPDAHYYLATHDITVDVTAGYIAPEDFVAAVHGVEPFNYEVYPITDELGYDAFWMDHWPFDCEDLGENFFWVRVPQDGNGVSSIPTKAKLTITDAVGQCGDPQLQEGPNE